MLLKIVFAIQCLQFSQKTDYNTRINEIEKKVTNHNYDKYINSPEFNKLTSDYFWCNIKKS